MYLFTCGWYLAGMTAPTHSACSFEKMETFSTTAIRAKLAQNGGLCEAFQARAVGFYVPTTARHLFIENIFPFSNARI